VAACNTISYIMATAARRAVISLIKSPVQGEREKRPLTLKHDSSSCEKGDLTGEENLIHYSGTKWNNGVKELHRRWCRGVCRTERILHLSGSRAIAEVIVKRQAVEGTLRGQKKKDSQRGCNGFIDVSTTKQK